MSVLYVDIETLPQVEPIAPVYPTPPDFAAILPASNLRDPEKIAASINERRARAVADHVDACAAADRAAVEAWERTALDPLRGRIACIAWAIGDGDVCKVWALESVEAALDELDAAIGTKYLQWCGHNIAGFDLRWIMLHALRIQHPIARMIPYAKWDKRVIDTMDIAAGPNPAGGKMAQADLARFFGLAVDTPPGSEVLRLYREGRNDEILNHCVEDVAIVRAIHNRFTNNAPGRN